MTLKFLPFSFLLIKNKGSFGKKGFFLSFRNLLLIKIPRIPQAIFGSGLPIFRNGDLSDLGYWVSWT